MSFRAAFLPALAALGLASCGKPVNPDVDYNGANRSSAPLENKNFAYLITHFHEGRPEHAPWAGYWWPYALNATNRNGIAWSPAGDGTSPAGRYDAARGGQTHAQDWEAANHSPVAKDVDNWTGHCNGWCAASALFDEPRHPVQVNGVTFSVADIKALLTEAGMGAIYDMYGTPVEDKTDFSSPKWKDTVPDQYFLVLTNYMGVHRMPVMIDRYTGYQIWNQPLMGYQFDLPTRDDYKGEDPRVKGIYRIHVRSRIWWANDGVRPGILTPEFQFDDCPVNSTGVFMCRQLDSELWLDAPVRFAADGSIASSGNVLVTHEGPYFAGGRWANEDSHDPDQWPDFMWVPYSIPRPSLTRSQTAYNPYVDIDWIREHLLDPRYPDGRSDPGAAAAPSIRPAPVITQSPGPAATPAASQTPQPGR